MAGFRPSVRVSDAIGKLMAQIGQHGSLTARITLCERDIVDLKKGVF